MQKKNPLYEEMKEETVWSMDAFNEYVNENFAAENNLPDNWVHTVLRVRLSYCFSVRAVLIGFILSDFPDHLVKNFDLLGNWT